MRQRPYCWPQGQSHDKFVRLGDEIDAVYASRRRFAAIRRVSELRAAIVAALTLVSIAVPFAALADESAHDASFLSRITVDVPFYSRHEPHSVRFNNHNWGAFVDIAFSEHWSAAAGDFINSYKRNTIFAGVAYTPLQF